MGWPEWFTFLKLRRGEDQVNSWFPTILSGRSGYRSDPTSEWFLRFFSQRSDGDKDWGICLGCIRTAPVYIFVLSVFGIVASVLDIMETHKCVLPACDWRSLVPETNTNLLRTAKFASSGLYITLYADLFLGVFMSVADLLLPYLIVQLVTILLAIVNIVIVIVKNRCAFQRAMAIQLFFMVINWLQCYCHYSVMQKPGVAYCRKTDV